MGRFLVYKCVQEQLLLIHLDFMEPRLTMSLVPLAVIITQIVGVPTIP